MYVAVTQTPKPYTPLLCMYTVQYSMNANLIYFSNINVLTHLVEPHFRCIEVGSLARDNLFYFGGSFRYVFL